MLIQTVAKEFGGKVRVVNEDFGASELAELFGVKRYPAVFVNDVLIAKPKDFGFYGASGSQGTGRYTPWLNAENHQKFKADLERSVRLALQGKLEPAEGILESSVGLSTLPAFQLTGIDGKAIDSSELTETVTIVEFWASWCPPCLKSMPWLVALQEKYQGKVQIVSIAIESDPEDVKRIAESKGLNFPTILGDAELVGTFGDLTSVPTMFLFERGGKLAEVIYGAPPGLHGQVEALLEKLTEQGGKQ